MRGAAVSTICQAALALCAGAVIVAYAQDAPPRAVEEIVVTAQKKAENVQDVPISITAFGGDFLREAGIEDIHGLSEYTPNVKFTTNPGAPTVFIRGFGTPFGGTTLEPSVGLALDELAIAKEIYMSDPLYDLERFEVLRGPQGILFGKNTSAGLFNLTTVKPSSEFTGSILGRVGSLGVHRVELGIGGPLGPIGDVAQFRFAAVDSRLPGDVRNTALDIDEPAAKQRAARLQLALQPFESTEVLLIGSRATSESRIFHDQLSNLKDSHLQFLRKFDPEIEDDPFNHQNSVSIPENFARDTYILQTNVRQRLDWQTAVRGAELVGVFAHTGFEQVQPVDADWSPAAIVDSFPADFDYDQSSAEIRFLGGLTGPFGLGEIDFQIGSLFFVSHIFSDNELIAGKDFDEYLLSSAGFELATGIEPPGGIGFQSLDEAARALGVDPLGSTPGFEGDGLALILRQKVDSKAVFGNATWQLNDEWAVGFGGRLTFESKDAHAVNRCPGGIVCAAVAAETFDLDLSRQETDFSPRATLQYSPFDTLSLFAARAQGFKSGGFNNFSFTRDAIEVDTETAVSYEVGAKGRLFEASLGYSVTLFHMEVEDLQVQSVNQAAVQTRNAASARSRGIEVDFQYLTPWEPLTLQGAGSYTDARYTEFPNAPAPASSGMDVQDLGGERLPFIPRVQVNVTPKLRFPFRAPFLAGFLPHDLVATTALDVSYKSNIYMDNDLDPNTLQDGYALLNARVALSSSDEALSIGVTVDNLTDADTFELKNDSVFFPGGYVVIQEFQRRYFFDVRYAW